MVSVFAQKSSNPSNLELIGELDQDIYDKLRRTIQGYCSSGCNTLIDQLLRKGKWDEGISDNEYQKSVLAPVIDIIHTTSDVNVDELQKLIDNKSKYTYFTDAIKSGTQFNLVSLLHPVASKIFSDPVATTQELYNYSSSLARIGVGKGEVLLSMLTSAYKGESGDLMTDDWGEIEIKGSGGRPGKDKCALSSIDTISNYLQSKGFEIYTGSSIRNSYIKAINIESKLIGYLDELINKIQFNTSSALVDGFIKLHNGLNIVSQSLHDIDINVREYNLIRICLYILEIINSLPHCPKFGSAQKSKIKNLADQYIEEVKNIINIRGSKSINTGYNMTFSEVIKNAFNVDWGLDYEEYIQLLLHVINESSVLHDDIKTEVYRDNLHHIVTPNRYERLIRGDYRALKSIIATIHTVSYQHAAKFRSILWINDNTLNALPMIFDEDTSDTDIIDKFNIFERKDIKIDPNLDPQSATGVQIYYTG